VVEVEDAGYCVTNGGCFDFTFLTVEFVDGVGNVARASYRSPRKWRDVHAGDTIPIIFDPVDPRTARDEDHGDPRDLETFWYGGTGLALLTLSAVIAYRLRARPGATQEGLE
jgi:hypothetical protein